MQIDNLNIISLLIFASIGAIAIGLFVQNYFRRESLKQLYKLMFMQTKLFYLRYLFLILALLVASMSIFKVTYLSNNANSEAGLDIVFVLDVSKSMNVRDIVTSSETYSRLEYSKKKISEYMLKHNQNRYGLVIFAGDAISISPLSNNYDGFLSNLSGVNYSNIAQQGTNLLTALELGYMRFEISEDDTGTALVLISDGGESEDSPDMGVFKDINTNNIPSQVLAVGTKAGGPIPIGQDPFGGALFQKYQGHIVIPKINSSILKALASNIGGEYGLLQNFENQLDNIKRKAIKKTQDKYKQELTNILVGIASILFILYLLFPYFIRGRK